MKLNLLRAVVVASLLLATFLFVAPPNSFAGTCTAPATNVGWASAAWTGGCSGSYGGHAIPGNGDDVIIPSGSTITLGINSSTTPAAPTLRSATINNNGILTMGHQSNGNWGELITTGDVVINSGGKIDTTNDPSRSQINYIRYGGNFTNNGTFNPTSSGGNDVTRTTPRIPTAANQYRSDGTTAIPEGGNTNESTVVFKATVSDPDGNQVKLQIELRQTTEAFTGTPTFESSLVNSGTQVTVTRSGLGSASYKWRYRAMDAVGLTSSWAEFGTVGNTDFVVVGGNSPPNTPTAINQYQSDGTTAISEGGSANGSTVVFKGTVSDPDGSQVKLQIELRQTTEAFTGTPTFESSLVNSGTQATIPSSALGSASYRWRYRAMDVLGATSSWAEFGTVGNTDFIVPDNRPNIIYILTDDQDVDSAAYMPKLQSLLVRQGITFGNFYVNVSLCAPSRATTLRGQYAHNTGIFTLATPEGTGFDTFKSSGKESSTIATWLKASGYRTGFVGKYINDYPGNSADTYVPPGWDEWYSPTGNCCPFYTQYNYTLNQNGSLVSYGSSASAYLDDVISNLSNSFIQRAAGTGKPFFLHITPPAPHVASATAYPVPAPRHVNDFPGAQAPRDPSYNEADVSDKPAYIRALPLLTSAQMADMDTLYRKRLQMMEAVDEMIERLINTLKSLGKYDNTYIFYQSDNGYHLGQHRLTQGKESPYEEDMNVPMVVIGPGVPAGQLVGHLTGNIDLAPTIAELAGVTPPYTVDGRSLVPLLGNNRPAITSWRQAYLLGYSNYTTQGTANGVVAMTQQEHRPDNMPVFSALRTIDYKYVEYTGGERELYDLNTDPYELQNLYATASQSVKDQLSSQLAQLRGCAGASCQAAENIPTAVKLRAFTATDSNGKVLLEWRTGYEVDNLGFHLYREENGERVRVTPGLVAGSAFRTGRTPMTSGFSYAWLDTSLSDQQSANSSQLQYYLEDIDLSGKRTMHGPVTPVVVQGPLPTKINSSLLSEIGRKRDDRYEEFWRIQDLKQKLGSKQSASNLKASMADPQGNEVPAPLSSRPEAVLKAQASQSDLDKQWSLAAGSAVKISVKEEGWYRVNQPDLVAAGLNPKVNPWSLQLFVDGKEQPIRVIGQGDMRFGPEDAIEFYATGLDTASTDTRVYWLIDGKAGKRIPVSSGQRSPGAPASFQFTLQEKPRTIYFPNLRNGDVENFFGDPVFGDTEADVVLSAPHLATAPPGNAQLEVVLQGATDGAHQVDVFLNNAPVGSMAFNGQSSAPATFSIPQSALLEGDNFLTLKARGGDTDISVIDVIRLTYWHTYTADNDSLKFTAQGGKQLSVAGFSNQNIRVMDITDPSNLGEARGTVRSKGTSYSITFGVPGSGTRTLLAFTDGQAKQPTEVKANQPSSWHQSGLSYDFVMIAYKDFLQSLTPLKGLRESQGFSVALIDVEDLYDEFSFGNKSTQALRDFLSRAKSYWGKSPKAVLLVGNAFYDPRNYLNEGGVDYVPTKFIDTAYLETASDDWFVDFNGDGLPDMAMGRIPVSTVQDVATVVSKITGYEQSTRLQKALLVADMNDGYDFAKASLAVGALLPSGIVGENIFRGSFGTDEEVTAAILDGIDLGPLLVNYIGHGSVDLWRGVLDSGDVATLANGMKLPFVVSMTCLNGFYQDLMESLAEAFVKAKQGGAVAVWASSALTETSGQMEMNKELIRQLFNRQGLTIGEAIAKAKAATTDQDVRRTWILFGDPTTKLK